MAAAAAAAAAALRRRRAARSGASCTRLSAVAEATLVEAPQGGLAPEGGRVALVTGGTSRLGRAIALGLAHSGQYGRPILVGRDENRARGALDELRAAGVEADFWRADLASLDEVRRVASLARGTPLHCLVCAAGPTALARRRETADGLEYHFGVNFLAHFHLATSLIEELRASGSAADPSRVLLLCNARHRGFPVLGFASLGAQLPLADGSLEDLQWEHPGAYEPWGASGQAALCNVMFAYELQRRLRHSGDSAISAMCFDPGPLDSAWSLYQKEENRVRGAGWTPWQREMLSYFTRVVEPAEAVAPAAVELCTTHAGVQPSGPQVGPWGYWERGHPVPSKFPLPWSWGTSYDEAVWARLWDHAAGLAGRPELRDLLR